MARCMAQVMPQSGPTWKGLSSLGPNFVMGIKGSWTLRFCISGPTGFLSSGCVYMSLWKLCKWGEQCQCSFAFLHALWWLGHCHYQAAACHAFFHYRPQLVVGWGLTQPAQADPWLMGTERNHISSVGSFENYISSSSKSESANNLCDGFSIRIQSPFFLPSLCLFGKETKHKTIRKKLKFQTDYRWCFDSISSSSYWFDTLDEGSFYRWFCCWSFYTLYWGFLVKITGK